MEKFRWAYLGAGGIAATTAEEIVRSGEHEIVAVWNRTRSKAEAFVEQFGGRVYDSIEEAVCAPGVEGVYLATTADRHPEHVRICVAHGKPVLCEKPFAVNARVVLPELKFCGDNAAMIAAQGYYEYMDGNVAGLDLNGLPTLGIDYR